MAAETLAAATAVHSGQPARGVPAARLQPSAGPRSPAGPGVVPAARPQPPAGPRAAAGSRPPAGPQPSAGLRAPVRPADPAPVVQVVRGAPTDEELAALILVLVARAAPAPAVADVAVGRPGQPGRRQPHRVRPGWARPARYRSPASWRPSTVH